MEKYVPDMYKENIYKIDYDKLKQSGVKCILFDLDNTLVPYYEKEPRKEINGLFTILKNTGFRIIIFSNSPKKRLKKFNEKLDVEIYWSAKKPLKRSFNKILKKYKYDENEVAIVGDQLLTDIVGGNKVGIMTVLVTPLESKDPIWTKINRHRENKIMSKLRLNNMFKKGRYYD